MQRRVLRPTRFAVVYDIDGPRIRLGAAWFVLLAGAFVVGMGALSVLYAAAAALAGYQAATAWRQREQWPNRWAAGLAAGAIALAGLGGSAAVGLAVLGALPVILIVSAADRRVHGVIGSVGLTIQCSLFVGLAGASALLAWDVDFGAAIVLVALVCAYEVGDFVVGSGSTNSLEGPIAGMAAIGVVTFALWAINMSPFEDDALIGFGGLAAALAPVGQLLASAVLPAADARAPALRRLDTLLVLGPVWAIAARLYVDGLS